MPSKSPQTRRAPDLPQTSASPLSASRVQTRSMARANAARTLALSTPPRHVRTYDKRHQTSPLAPRITVSSDGSSRLSARGVHRFPAPRATQPRTTGRTPCLETDEAAEEVTTTGSSNSINADSRSSEPKVVDVSNIAAAERALNTAMTGLKFACRCDICYLLMQRPFTLECGHSSCGPCLRLHFSSLLAPRLAVISCKIPTTADEMEHVVDLAWSAGIVPRALFSYICPTCRKPIKAPPFDHIGFKSLIVALRTAFEDWPSLLKDEMGWADESDVTGTGYFNNFFLQKK